ncbi:MAG TPA: HAMP domain-containing sensor histidine kinase [Pseudonocardia sp.]|nr:HAMP domain-containing sensor histidine kinase [Pseudonocardia sp.]
MSGRGPRVPAETLLRRTGRRLGVQAAAIVSVIVVLLTGTAVLVVVRSQHTAAEDLLSQALERADDVDDPPSAMWLSQLGPDGTIHRTAGSPDLPAADDALRQTGATGARQEFDLHTPDREYRVQTSRRADGSTFGAALDLRANHAERNRLIAAMLGAGGVSLLLAAAAGAWLGRRATEPLSTALTLQRRFVGDASHELRTPLTLLSTRTQLLRRRLRSIEADAETLSTTDRVVADTQRLATILDDLLLAADPAAARTSETVDLAGLGAEVVAEAEPAGAERSIRITGPTAGDPEATVRGSATALRRAITALVDNAVRHADRSVEVSVHRARRHVVLEVADDGAGVDPELASRLFDRFVSARPADTGGRRHYGLGLALVSDIVASHGGTVELAGRAHRGTVFRITLPAPRRRRAQG